MPQELKRIISFAFVDFNRNKGISVAAIFVLVAMIMLVSGLFFFHGVADYVTNEIQNKIDITAYFKDDTSETDILAVKDQLLQSSSAITNIDYISKDQALELFKEKYQDNNVLSTALTEVGSNPFLPSLNIITNGEPAQYEQISTILQASDLNQLLDRVDFLEKRDTIEKVYKITKKTNQVGVGLSIIFLIVSILVVFNTIKLAIDSSKEEITTMKIVGASDWFIRGPFIICGALYGLLAFIISFIFCLVITYIVSNYTGILLPGFSLFKYLLTNMLLFVLIQLAFGVGVGVFSSFVVVRKYLR